jgi:DNA-directed RNA polymerase specialized sigma24 family protein
VDPNGNKFVAYHSPSVVTEQVPVEAAFSEFGQEQLFITRKVRTIEPRTLTIDRAPKREKRVKIGAAAELDEPITDDEDEEENSAQPIRRTSHEAYVADLAKRERGLNNVYAGYVAGTAPASTLLTHVERAIRVKANTQRNLYLLRDDNAKTLNTIDDHVQDFLMKVWPQIEARKIVGPLANWLNAAFHFHFIRAKRKHKTERFRWRRFLDANEGTVPEETPESLTEQPVMAVRSLTTPAPPAPDSAPESPSARLFTGSVSLRTMEKAKREFLRRHPRGDKRNVFFFMSEGHNQRQTGILLHLSESKVSRVWAQVESEIREIAREIALERAIERRKTSTHHQPGEESEE